jgi:glycosyltransferase involved in cell wall biosynthesis
MGEADSDRPGDETLGRLLVINQVVGPLMRELLEDLAEAGVDGTAVAGWVDAPGGRPPRFPVWPAARLVKAPAWRRVWTWGRFTLQALWRLARTGRQCPALVVTNPPLTMLALPWLRRLVGLRYVLLVYDIYPEAMERMGMLRPDGWIARWWRGRSRASMRSAEGVITLGRKMADTLAGHLRPGDDVTIEIIPNWADTEVIRPRAKQDNPFAIEHGLVGKFVVLYSGAFGATHDTSSIIAAAGQLTDRPEVHFMLIGGGTRRAEVEREVAEADLPNLTLLDFQPLERLPLSLTVADCSIVCLDEGYQGISVPSKTYYALAAGAAVLAVSPPDTELTDLVAETRCGRHVSPRNPDRLAEAVRFYADHPQALAEARANARRAAETEYSRAVCTRRYHSILRAWLGVESSDRH